jgi:hypothetical protein
MESAASDSAGTSARAGERPVLVRGGPGASAADAYAEAHTADDLPFDPTLAEMDCIHFK